MNELEQRGKANQTRKEGEKYDIERTEEGKVGKGNEMI